MYFKAFGAGDWASIHLHGGSDLSPDALDRRADAFPCRRDLHSVDFPNLLDRIFWLEGFRACRVPD